MTAAIRTIFGIVRLRTASRTRRPVRPQPGAAQRTVLVDGGRSTQPRGRRRPSPRLVLLIIVALLAVGGAIGAIMLTMPRIEAHGPIELTNDATPTLTLDIEHPRGIRASRVEATIDGERIASERIEIGDAGARVQVAATQLDDGEHDVRLAIHDTGLLRRTIEQRWTLTVDTTAPKVTIIPPKARAASEYVAADVVPVTKSPLRLTVASESNSTLEVASSRDSFEPVIAGASEQQRRSVQLRLPEGAQTLSVTVTDAAGNAGMQSLKVHVDTTGPKLTVRTPRVVKDATLALPINARDAHGVELQARLDGRLLEDALQVISSTPAPQHRAAADTTPEVESDTDAEGGAEMRAPIEGSYQLKLAEGAYEGRHVLEVVATDTLGATTTVKRTFVVDSTDTIAAASGLRVGARGADVLELHDALVEQQVVTRAALAKDRADRMFGADTKGAVQAYQQRQGMDVDGIAGATTIAGLTLKIVINRSTYKLTLFRAGAAVKSWGIAVGSPKYPTPAGDFQIQSMQKNPTWTPPDSDWAKDAEVTPPGPDNPLGTRWMAIDGTVGIHGTNDAASLGYSVSHGCIRMAIPDVEELFEMVSLGTRVTVV